MFIMMKKNLVTLIFLGVYVASIVAAVHFFSPMADPNGWMLLGVAHAYMLGAITIANGRKARTRIARSFVVYVALAVTALVLVPPFAWWGILVSDLLFLGIGFYHIQNLNGSDMLESYGETFGADDKKLPPEETKEGVKTKILVWVVLSLATLAIAYTR